MNDTFQRDIGEKVHESEEKTTYVYTIGVSEARIRDFVADYIATELKPDVVLDLGCGTGAYGAVLKELLPRVEMIGVDGCYKYLSSVFCLNSYKARIHMDIMDFMFGHVYACQELTLCMDVIEHFHKVDATIILNNLPEPSIISTPLFWYEQGMVEGNPLEEHRCFFTEDELSGLGFDKLFSYEYDERGDIGAFIKRI